MFTLVPSNVIPCAVDVTLHGLDLATPVIFFSIVVAVTSAVAVSYPSPLPALVAPANVG